MKLPFRLIHVSVLVFLFLSGMAGLVYEIVWARYLALFLGHTSYAIVMVLVAFMGGLAIGNFWLGRLADRARAPLALYGWLEIGIGAYALGFPWYYGLCHQLFVKLATGLPPGGAAILVLKSVFSLGTILLPTMLMGGTLPVLTKFVTRSLAELQGRVAALYAVNSAGAVAGCIVADFWLIPASGLHATLFAAAVVNLAVGIASLLASRAVRIEAELPANEPPSPASIESFTAADLRLAIISIGVSGFVAMLYEVAWTRLLALVLGSSTHAFSLMLITFIAGLTVGAWIINRWKTLRRMFEAFAWAEIALAVTILGSMFTYQYLPFWFMKFANLLARREGAYPLYELWQGVVCFGVMFVPTVCLGMTLPLVSRIATQELSTTGRAVGRVFAVNTLGTVLGAAVTGLWLMPALGLARTFALGVGANAIVGLAILGRRTGKRQLAWVGIATLLTLGFVWLAGSWFHEWPSALTLGLWRKEKLPSTFAEVRQSFELNKVEYHRDGATATVTVRSFVDDTGTRQMNLTVNGKTDASSSADMPTQLLLGHVPMLLHPQSEQVLVIGLGGGITCGAVAAHPTIRRLDVVEISPEVVEAARVFAPHNGHILDDARLHLAIEDAKTFLQITPQTYDVIISEPSNPWMAGVAGVFSREFYESCRARMRPDGVMTQWLHVYENSDEAVEIVMRTFADVFPHISVWQTPGNDLLFVGSIQPMAVDLAALATRFQHPSVKADLGRIQMRAVPVFLACEVVSQENGAFVPAANARRHSDLHPLLEYLAPKAFFVRAGAKAWQRFDETRTPRASTLFSKYIKEHPLTVADLQAFTLFYSVYTLPRPDIFRSLLFRWQQIAPGAPEPIELAVQLPARESSPELDAQYLASLREAIWRKAQTDPTYLNLYRRFLVLTYRAHRSVFFLPPSAELQAVLGRLIETDPEHQRVYKFELAELAWDSGNEEACLQLGFSALNPSSSGGNDFKIDPEVVPDVIAHMAEAACRKGNLGEALRICRLAAEAQYSSPLLEMTHRKLNARSERRSTVLSP